MWPNAQVPSDLVTFTEEILNGKFYFLHSVTNLTDNTFKCFSMKSYQIETTEKRWKTKDKKLYYWKNCLTPTPPNEGLQQDTRSMVVHPSYPSFHYLQLSLLMT